MTMPELELATALRVARKELAKKEGEEKAAEIIKWCVEVSMMKEKEFMKEIEEYFLGVYARAYKCIPDDQEEEWYVDWEEIEEEDAPALVEAVARYLSSVTNPDHRVIAAILGIKIEEGKR